MSSVKVIFTRPNEAPSHLEELVALVRNAPSGSTIRGCISHFGTSDRDERNLVKAFVDKSNEGVNVHLILRVDEENTCVNALRYFNEHPNNVHRYAAPSGCIGTNELHTKLLLLTRTSIDDAERSNVCVFGSATWTKSSTDRYQNTVIAIDDTLHADFVKLWDAMCRGAQNQPLGEYKRIFYSASQHTKVYVGPFPENDVLTILKQMHSSAHPESGNPPKLTIAMARWSDGERAWDLLKEVENLVEHGCKLDVAYRKEHTSGEVKEALANLKRRYPDLVRVFKGSTEVPQQDLHHKVFLFAGRHADGPEWEHNVWTGSVNWTGAGLHTNDELLVKLRSENLYRQYRQEFNDMIADLDEVT